MNRKELYAKVKELNLQEKIKKVYGDNYTRVGNTELASIIAEYAAPKVESKPKVASKVASGKGCKCDKLVEILKKKHILLDSEVSYINS